MLSNGLIYYNCLQVIKNLLFVAKVIYLISPESDMLEENEKEGGEKVAVEKTEEENEDEDEEQDDEEEEQHEGQIIEEQDEEDEQEQQTIEEHDDNRPPSLLWVIRKLTLLAKREAANTPKVPMKVYYQVKLYI